MLKIIYFFLGRKGSRGNILRTRISVPVICDPAITTVTAATISISPRKSRGVMLWPRIVTPKNIAEAGSSAPRMAVGIGPIICIARVVHIKEMAVGNTARPIRLPQ